VGKGVLQVAHNAAKALITFWKWASVPNVWGRQGRVIMPLITQSRRAETEMFQWNTKQISNRKGPNFQIPLWINDYIRRNIYFVGLW